MSWLRDELPLLTEYTYADTAASGLLYSSLQQWRREHDQAFHAGGSLMMEKSFEILPETKQALGAFYGCDPALVALASNFSIGLNLLLDGMETRKQVLLVQGDYPSLNWPFESRGFQTHYVECDTRVEKRIMDMVSRHKIEILALSLVQWVNGMKIGARFLTKLKKAHPGLLIIADGTQFCGAFEFDFGHSGIDVLGASGYKWLLGGYGNAFFLFKAAAVGWFNPRATGFNSADGNASGRQEIAFPRQLEPGHLDSLNFGSLKFALNRLSSIGMKAVEMHNRSLGEHFRQGLKGTRLLDPVVWEREEHSTIFNVRGDKSMHACLQEEKIICSLRGGGIRLSFHLYNTMEEVERVLFLLRKAGV